MTNDKSKLRYLLIQNIYRMNLGTQNTYELERKADYQ